MEEDLTAKSCLSEDERYADLVNGLLLGYECISDRFERAKKELGEKKD